MTTPSPILLCLPPHAEESEDLGLPIDSDNIFQRLIRNPHLESDTPRERECTEMLCSVLRNSHNLRTHLLGWLGSRLAGMPSDFDDLAFQIDTEGLIGSKRDDLRIEAWRQSENGQECAILWSIEVKVGAQFHESSLQDADVTESDVDTTELVNQLVNYDRWLLEQPAECRAGFVLALPDMTNAVPPSLSMPWHCLTWTEIGLQVQKWLEGDKLPPTEELLAKHLLGFIKTRLWRVSDMSHDRIEFDDIALLRAFSQIGSSCDKKANRLVGMLPAIIEQADIGTGKITQSPSCFTAYTRAASYRQLFDKSVWAYPTLLLGIRKDHLSIWLDTPPGNEKKAPFNEVYQSLLPALHERNRGWCLSSLEERTPDDIELKLSLIDLLVVENQERAFTEFFSKALADLKAVQVVEALRQCL